MSTTVSPPTLHNPARPGLVGKVNTTYKKPINAPIATAAPRKPSAMGSLLVLKKLATPLKPVGSGFLNASLRFGSATLDGGLLGSKQYCLKHVAQKSERWISGLVLYRARSSAAHCRQRPKLGSGEFVSGWKPPIVFAWTWSMNSRVCSGV